MVIGMSLFGGAAMPMLNFALSPLGLSSTCAMIIGAVVGNHVPLVNVIGIGLTMCSADSLSNA